jgi:hypothetical protein
MDPPTGFDLKNRGDQEILVHGRKEDIGIALYVRGRWMYFTDPGGTAFSADMDGSSERVLPRPFCVI